MFNNLSFTSFTHSVTKVVNHLWDTAKSYLTVEPEPLWQKAMREPEQYHSAHYKQLIVMSAIGLLANNNNLRLMTGLAITALFTESAEAAYPTVINLIPVQYVQAGQSFSFDIDLGQVFNDTDGDVMVYAGIKMADGGPLPSWIWADLILLGSYNTAVSARDVVVQNNVAYVVDYDLLAINITNPKSLALLDSHRPPTSARAVAIQGQAAYVLHWNAGYAASLQVVDISNPRNLVLLSSYVLGGSNIITGIALQNTLAYIMDNNILRILDISNPMAPVSVSDYSYNLLSSRDIAVQGNIAYVAHSNILGLVDVSNANAPAFLDNLYLPDYANGVAVRNNTAYMACDLSGLQLVNTTDKRKATLLGNYAVPGVTAYGVVVQGNLAYVAAGGLQIINVTDVLNPSLLIRYSLSGYSWAVAVQNGVAYVANDAGLRTISLNQVRISVSVPTALSGSYNFTIYATNANNEKISTRLELRINPVPSPAPAPEPAPVPVPSPVSLSTRVSAVTMPMTSSVPSPMPTVTAPNPMVVPVPSTQMRVNSSLTSSMVTTLQSSVQPTSNAIIFSVIATFDPILIELGKGTVLTTDMLSISGNVNPDQVVYTVQGNNPNIVISVNGVEATQFTQADVEEQLVEITLNGVNCGEYSTNLQLEANVMGSNTSPQRADVGLIFAGTTCADAGRLSPFSFRDARIGFWAQGREVERETQPAPIKPMLAI